MGIAVLKRKRCLLGRAGVFLLCLCFVLSGCNLLSGGCDEDDPSSPTVTTDNEDLQILQSLGMNMDTEEERSEGVDNPYGRTTTNVNKTDEIFLITADNDTIELYNYSAANTQSTLNSFTTDNFTTAADLIKRPVAADIDGNGKEEVIVAVFSTDNNVITIYSVSDGDSQNAVSEGSLTWDRTQDYYSDITDLYDDPDERNNNYRWAHTIDIAAGDIDGDEVDEILLTSENTLYILGEDLVLDNSVTFVPVDDSGDCSEQILRVECGDVDLDGKEEIIVVNGSYDTSAVAEYSVYTSDSSGNLTTEVDGNQINSDGYSLRSADIAVGDVTGDGYCDIVFGGAETGNSENCTLVAKVNLDDDGDIVYADFYSTSWTDSYKSNLNTDNQARDASVPILAVGDLDFDGVYEIVSGDDILSMSDDEELEIFTDTGDDILRTGAATWGSRAIDTAYLNQVQVGDLTGDGCAEVVVLDFSRCYFRVYRYLVTGSMDYIDDDDHFDSFYFQYHEDEIVGDSPFFCLPDIDEDGLVLEYVGHSLEYSEPYLLAVLAAPPYWDLTDDNGDPIQNYSGSKTSFTQSFGSSVETGFSISKSTSASVGGEVTVPVISNGKLEIEFKETTTVSASFDTSCELSMETSYSTDPGFNYVLFCAYPIDVYVYEVVQVADDNVDGLVVGDYVNTTYARDVKLSFASVDFYNANNGTYDDVDDSILDHTIGNPRTYPTENEVNEEVISLYEGFSLLGTDGIVSQYSAENEISYFTDLSADVCLSYEKELAVSMKLSFIGSVGGEVAVSCGASVTIGASYGTGISGSVGGLNDPYYADSDYMYDWGIYSYYKTADEQLLPYTVINYWAEVWSDQ